VVEGTGPMKPGNQLSTESMVLHPAGYFLEDKSKY